MYYVTAHFTSFGLGTKRILMASGTTDVQQAGSNLRCYALRLGPGEEIVSSLMKLVEEKGILAGFVMTCVGSVQKARLRLAQDENTGKNEIIELKQKYEIVSLVGTLSAGGHLHVALSDAQGQVLGGHVMGDMVVFTTAEIVVGDCSDLRFSRPFDPRTGFPELAVGCRN